ncbi:MAG TPA: Ppx/GppA family phosphatase [Acidimicrobiia bacterium]|nr:Ppx/GppA family phosphatase [Acidimicrobiia bacterium]
MTSTSGSEVAHRWEWRVFGSRLDPGAKVLSQMTPMGDSQETDETYLLGPEHANLKVRFDLLDIKELVEVDENGLELWAPISKSEFPMNTVDIEAVLDSVGVSRPLTRRDVYTMDQFIGELIDPHTDLEVVHAHKRRVRFSLEGCMAELTTLIANGRETFTIAAESEDPDAVVAAVERLGMTGHTNTSYGRGLSCLLGFAPVRYAVIDIGTNSVKFHVGEQHTDGSWTRVVDRAEVSRLGEGLDEKGEIQPEPIERTVRVVESMLAEAKANQVLGIAVVGTAALRIASNSRVFTDSIHDTLGLHVEVITGEEESRLAYQAVAAGVGVADGEVVVFDTGGGSSQFTFGRGGVVDERYSLDVGAVSYTERFGLDGFVDSSVIDQTRAALHEDLSSLDGRSPPDALVGMGGAMTNITAVSLRLDPYDPDVVQGATVPFKDVERQIGMYRSMDQEERRSIVGLQPNRAPVILAGALIVATIMEKLGKDSVTVSDRGLRHGLIRERFGMFPA